VTDVTRSQSPGRPITAGSVSKPGQASNTGSQFAGGLAVPGPAQGVSQPTSQLVGQPDGRSTGQGVSRGHQDSSESLLSMDTDVRDRARGGSFANAKADAAYPLLSLPTAAFSEPREGIRPSQGAGTSADVSQWASQAPFQEDERSFDSSGEELEEVVPEGGTLQHVVKGSSWLDEMFPLGDLFADLRIRNPAMVQPAPLAKREVGSRSLEHYVSGRDAPVPNLPLSPAVDMWLEEQSHAFNSRSRPGSSKRVSAKGSLPRLPRVLPRFVPSDAPTLAEPPVLPEDWYKVLGSNSSPSPASYSWSARDMGDGAVAAGRDLSVLSELDWLVSGSSDILTKLVALPQCAPLVRDLNLLRRYSLEVARDIERLGKTTSARYANFVWRLRDGHLARIHSAVPQHSREALRGARLGGPCLFPEKDVASTAENLRGDVQLRNMSDSLRFIQDASRRPPESRKRPAPAAPARPPVKKVKFASKTPPRPSGAPRGRGRGFRTPKGKGKGRGKRSS